MITKAYFHQGSGQLKEKSMIQNVLKSKGIDCQSFSTEELHSGQVILNKNTVVAGGLSILKTVFEKIGFNPYRTCYPPSLHNYLKRNIWESTIGELLEQSQTNDLSNTFVKPKFATKLFTGFVIKDHDDLELIDDLPLDTEVHCSSVVYWYSEFRVYVCNANIIGVKNYRGDPSGKLNMQEVEEAIAHFEQTNECTAGYGIDFGLLLNEETALIEWNDGLALGNYGLDPADYTDLFLARWEQVLQEATF